MPGRDPRHFSFQKLKEILLKFSKSKIFIVIFVILVNVNLVKLMNIIKKIKEKIMEKLFLFVMGEMMFVWLKI